MENRQLTLNYRHHPAPISKTVKLWLTNIFRKHMGTNVDSHSLALKLSVAGIKSQAIINDKNSNPLIANGSLEFSQIANHLMVHTCDLIEASNTTSVTVLAPCISINILLEGMINYQLGLQRHAFSTANQGAIVVVNIINQPEIFTRFMSKNHHVKKATLCFNKQWLTERGDTEKDKQLLQRVFNGENKVVYWQANNSIQTLANKLLAAKDSVSLVSNIEKEGTALDVLSRVLNELDNKKIIDTKPIQFITTHTNQEHDWLNKLNQLLDDHLSLQDIANTLAMSVSTLQRKFKHQYKMTVIEYQRQRKLNQSRIHLLVDKLSIGETAYLAGYKHPSNFNYAFKQQFNITPSEFIKRHHR